MKALTIKEWPASERPRERLLATGASGLSDTELNAVLLGHGTAGQSAIELSRVLIDVFGSIRGILNATPQD